MHELISLLKPLVDGKNQFASGGLLLMAIGAIGASLRRVPIAIYTWFLRQTTLTLIITDEVEGYHWFHHWFGTSQLGENARQVDLKTPFRDGEHQVYFNIAPGSKWIIYNKRLVRISFTRKESQNAFGDRNKRIESVELFTFGRNPKFFRSFILQAKTLFDEKTMAAPELFVWEEDYWKEVKGFKPRHLSSVILDSDVKQSIVDDITRFNKSAKWYNDVGIPYHRGYLLHGIPGSGKTALVTGLSNHLNAKVYLLKLNQLNDRQLVKAVNDVMPNSIILLEDVDIVVPKQRTLAQNLEDSDDDTLYPVPKSSNKREQAVKLFGGVTLAGLLNVLDGIEAPSGVLFFLTTNDISQLDAALVRPGRIDMKIEFKAAARGQKIEMFKRFFPTRDIDEDLLTNHGAVSMADFQEVLLRQREEEFMEQLQC